jgi:hypothetical protein
LQLTPTLEGMDSLDLNVHSAILTSLAQCYATSSANDEPVAILAKLSALSLSDQTRKEVRVSRFGFMATPPGSFNADFIW